MDTQHPTHPLTPALAEVSLDHGYYEFAMPIFLCRAPHLLPFSAATLTLHIAQTCSAEHRTFHLKVSDIATRYNVAQSTVSAALATLKQLNYITETHAHGRNGISGKLGLMFGAPPRETHIAVKAYTKHFELRPTTEHRDLIANTVQTTKNSLALWHATLYDWSATNHDPTDILALCRAYVTRTAFSPPPLPTQPQSSNQSRNNQNRNPAHRRQL